LLYLTSSLQPKSFYLFGAELGHSLAQLIHSVAFNKLGLPYTYEVRESTSVEGYLDVMTSDGFGGASVTRPHKVSIVHFLRRLSPHAQAIGAVNTIIASPAGPIGENTDWRAIHTCILRCRFRSNFASHDPSVLVVGAGGVARVAVYAILQLGFKRVQVINRSIDRANALVSSLGRLDPDFDIVIVRDLGGSRQSNWEPPDVIISTIPQLESRQELECLLPLEHVFAKPHGILLDMAYAPRRQSPLNQLLSTLNGKKWDSISGTDVLLEQAFEQIRLWTGKRAPRSAILAAVEKEGRVVCSSPKGPA
jgi:pentafunctional AROM polypeptide